MPKLNQIIAIEKGVKGRAQKAITELYRAAGQPALFNGFTKVYNPSQEDGDTFPPESQRVQANATDSLKAFSQAVKELFDVTMTKDCGNTEAVADIVLEDGKVIMSDVPPTFLLFLEKQLNDINTYVASLPELDPAFDWKFDADQRVYRSATVKTGKTRKDQVPLVLYNATDKHPAQTQLITQDVTIGYWDTEKLSGAVAPERKKQVLDRISALIRAVKFAREAANATEITRQKAGDPIMQYLFGE
jgi:hypothetical protein